jgi:hypothetical protein
VLEAAPSADTGVQDSIGYIDLQISPVHYDATGHGLRIDSQGSDSGGSQAFAL